MTDANDKTIQTTLGRDIRTAAGEFVLDLADLPVFRGLSVLSRALGEMFEAQAQDATVDVSIERAVRPGENPELIAEFGLRRIRLSVERDLAHRLVAERERLQDCLRTILGTLQRPRYRDAIFPGDDAPSHALVFRLEIASELTRFVLERICPRPGSEECALRLTIEDPSGRRLDLASLPHLEVEELAQRIFIAGSTRIAQTLAEGMRREAEVGRRRHSERRRPWQHLFAQLDKAGLDGFEEVLVTWTDADLAWILESQPERLENVAKQVLLALEDLDVRALLRRGECLRVDAADTSAWIETSQLHRVLHISIGHRRLRPLIDDFLKRMPALQSVVAENDALPFENVSIYLVHHITSEVIGTIAALRELGCRDLTVAFVAYASNPPGEWLAALLDLPQDEFRCFALMHVPAKGSVEGRYTMSPRYSSLEENDALEAALDRDGLDYLSAMRAITLPTFFDHARRARADERELLLIEDGGYVAPVLHDAILTQRDVGSVLTDHGTPSQDSTAVDDLLDEGFHGSVEHTRNGYERLAEVAARHGKHGFASFSIAISRHKIDTESSEVAVSVLHAIETLLHSDGRILSRRTPLVLGNRGAIGSRIQTLLERRLTFAPVLGVDLVTDPVTQRETRAFDELDEADRRAFDLVIGATGVSVLEGQHLEDWLLHGTPRELLFASASTKTVEFAGLARWIETLLAASEPRIGDRRVDIRHEDVVDPQTERVYGDRWRFRFEAANGQVRERSIVFAAHMTPINFLFYGVSTEMIDEVLAQLLSTSLGLVRRSDVEPGLYAVDHEIDARGRPLNG